MPLTHQTARWLDEPSKPLGKYRYIDQLSLPQLACCIIGVLCGIGVFMVTISWWPFCLPLGILTLVGISGAGFVALRGRKEPYARQLAGYGRRALVRHARRSSTSTANVVVPLVDDAGVIDDGQ